MKIINCVNPVYPVKTSFRRGFSLTEMLIATGIMAIGLVMVATIFPVGVKLTTLTTERTVGAVAADEAFAKVQLYGLRDFAGWPMPASLTCSDFQYTAFPDDDYKGDGTINFLDMMPTEWDGFLYPSAAMPAGQDRNYHWSALCRRIGPKDVQVTVFVTRKIAAASQYYAWDFDSFTTTVSKFLANADSLWPKPVPVRVDFEYSDTDPLKNKQLILKDPQDIFGNPGFDIADCTYFFDDGYTIVDDRTGTIYRIVEVDRSTGATVLTLQETWQWLGYPSLPGAGYKEDRTIWVVPPAVGSDRYPCVGVYQKVIRFD